MNGRGGDRAASPTGTGVILPNPVGVHQLRHLPAAHLQLRRDGPLAQALSMKGQRLLVLRDASGAPLD